MILRWAICSFTLTAIFADALVFRYDPPWFETWVFYYGIYYVANTVLIAAWFLAHHHWAAAVIYALLAAFNFYTWWNRTRRRRKKLADKASGIVVDVGGKLKVVREPIAEP